MSHASFSVSLLAAGLLLTLPLSAVPAMAQQPADSVRAKALEDFHGPDGQGKDGPLAKAGLDLLLLYHEHQAFQQEDGAPFSPSVLDARVRDGHITIDAVAQDEAKQLRADLKALGFKDATAAGRIVSGRLPIDRIPEMARLESLRGVALSQMETQGDTSPQTPSELTPTAPDDAAPASSETGELSSENAPDGETGVLVFLLGVLGILLLTEL